MGATITEHSTPTHDVSGMNLTQTLLSRDTSLRKQKEQPETYMFQTKMDKMRRGNLT